MNMSISDKDKQVLVYVLSALLVLAAWYFGFRHFNEEAEKFKSQSAQLEQRYNDLAEKQKNKAKYIADTAVYNEEAAKILSNYMDGHSLENTIKYIYEMEDDCDIYIDTFSISDGQLAYSFASGDKQGIVVPINITYEATYDTTKQLISYINNFTTKCRIDNMSIDYDTDDDVATGSLNLNLFAVVTPESTKPEVNIDMPIGNDNMFISTTVYYSDSIPQTGDYIIEDNDISIQLIQPTANGASVSVGITDGADRPLTSNAKENEKIELVFGGTAGRYTVAYKVGNTSYPARNYNDGVLFEPGETIDVLVSSTARANANDKLTADVTIINNTDKIINVKVVGDEEAGRFKLAGQTGRVKVY